MIKKYELALKVLRYFSEQGRPVLRANLIGLDGQPGNIEGYLSTKFSNEDRNLLEIVLDDLKEKGLVQAAYQEIINRGHDLQITEKGRNALESKVLDKLDELLSGLDSSSNLVEIRYGAYDAALSRHTDWQRHVATSLVELIDKTLRAISPGISEEEVQGNQQGSKRKARISTYIKAKLSRRSDSLGNVIGKAFELVESCRVRLEAIKHNEPKSEDEAEKLIKLTEDALVYLLDVG